MSFRFSRRLDWAAEPNAVSLAEQRLRGSIRFDLTESNPNRVNLPGAEEHRASLARALARGEVADFVPTPGGSLESRQAIANVYGERGVTVGAEQIVLTTSTSESYSYLFKLLCNPGDVVLVPQPSYPLFDYLARLEGLDTAVYDLEFVGSGGWRIDLESLARVLTKEGARVGAVVLVTPNNPTGSVLRREEFKVIDRLCADRGVAIIADEVFADYVFEPRADHVASVAGTDPGTLTFSLGGLSKSCGLPQLKLGWIAIAGPAEPVAQARTRLDLIVDTYLPLAAPVEVALGDLLEIGRRRRLEITRRIAENQDFLRACLGIDSAITSLANEGGWQAIVRLPSVQDDEAWTLELLERDHVMVHPGYFFDLRQGTFLVVSLLPAHNTFRGGVERLVERVRQKLA